MNHRVKHITKKLGYCCPYAFFKASANEKQIVLAMQLGVSERTVKLWRRQLREGTLTCQRHCPCFIELRTAHELPRKESLNTSD